MKMILITGCSSGLGKRMAQLLAKNGYRVYAGFRKEEEINQHKIIYQKQNLNIIPIKLDITSYDDCKMAVSKIISKEKRIDILINNAAYSIAGPTIDFSAKDYQNILNTNTVGAFRLIKEVVPEMIKRKNGRIINITSLNGLVALPNFGLYSSSKFALEALGQSLGFELKKYNIFVTNVEPGAIKREIDKPWGTLPHVPAREKFPILKLLFPMVTEEKVAKEIVELIEKDNPARKITIGIDSKITAKLYKYLPEGVWIKIIQTIWDR